MSKPQVLCVALLLCVASLNDPPVQAGARHVADSQRQQDVVYDGTRPIPALVAGESLALAPATPVAGLSQDIAMALPELSAAGSAELPTAILNTGLLPELEPTENVELMEWLHDGIWFDGDWSANGLRTALQGLDMTLGALDGNLDKMKAVLGITRDNTLVYRVCAQCFATGAHFTQPELRRVTFDSNPDLTSFLHETGHIVDYTLARSLNTGTTWWSEVGLIGLGWEAQVHQSGEAGLYYLDTNQDAPHTEYGPREDFADTFAAWVLIENGQPLPRRWRSPSLRRVLMLTSVPGALLE